MTGAMQIVIRQFVCAAVLATMASGFAQPPVAVPVPDDRAVSVGDWNVVAVEWNGKPVDPEFLSMLRVHFEADGGWSVLFKGMPAAAGRSTNRQDLTPKTFDMETLGSEAIKPRHYKGIYRIDGDIRLLCLAPDGAPRPQEFSAARHSGRMLVTLERAAKP